VRLRNLLTAGAATAALLFVGLTGTDAAATAAAPASPTTTAAPVMVILDASGSMNTADAPGPRITAAKRAVNHLVRSVPAGASVGLEVYGTSTGSSDAEKAAGCRDIKVLLPVAPVDKAAFTGTVAGIRASGYTPIGNALRKAAAALPNEGPRSIVLVSDGEDTCAPPQPCQVARELKRQGVDLTVHTVGFKVSGAARAQLQCIAAATGGTYRDASNGAALSEQLQQQVQRGLRGYAATGTPIAGGATPQSAAPMQPGQYVDTLEEAGHGTGGFGTTKYYTVDLPQGWTPYVAATLIPPTRQVHESIDFLVVTLDLGPRDEFLGCLNDTGMSSLTAGAMSAATAAVGDRVASTDSCLHPGQAIIKVARSGDSYPNDALKLELSFRLEPPAAADGLPGPALDRLPGVKATASGPTRSIEAGSSFNDAPELAPGRYSDSFVAGETRYVKVHVGWGQRLAVRYDLPRVGGVDEFSKSTSANFAMANPVRSEIDMATGTIASAGAVGFRPESMTGSMEFPARYRNRESRGPSADGYEIDGDYYLVLSTGYSHLPGLLVRYTMTIDVVGTPEPGPRYLTGGATSGSSTPAAPTSGRSSAASRPNAATVTPASAALHTDSGGPSGLWIGVIVAAAVLVIGGAGWLLVRHSGAARRSG
jgi:Ca-activated chloride channel family protein